MKCASRLAVREARPEVCDTCGMRSPGPTYSGDFPDEQVSLSGVLDSCSHSEAQHPSKNCAWGAGGHGKGV